MGKEERPREKRQVCFNDVRLLGEPDLPDIADKPSFGVGGLSSTPTWGAVTISSIPQTLILHLGFVACRRKQLPAVSQGFIGLSILLPASHVAQDVPQTLDLHQSSWIAQRHLI